MQKRGYAEQLRVEVDAVSRGVGATPEVGPHTVVEQGGRGVLRAHFQRGGRGRHIRQTGADLGSHKYLHVDRLTSGHPALGRSYACRPSVVISAATR